MVEFVTLSCPTCGGRLEVSRTTSRLACGFCGNEHLVVREGGTVSLRVANIYRLGEKEIYENVHPNYHLTLERILREYIQLDEDILFAGDATRITTNKVDYGKYRVERSSYSCLLVVTNYRWIRGQMSYFFDDRVVYKRVGSRFGAMLGEGPFHQHKWVTPPNKLPPESTMGGEEFSRRVREQIFEFLLKDLDKVRGKEYFSVMLKDKPLDLCEIAMQHAWVTLKRNDGDRVYTLLQLAARADGRIMI